MRPETGLALAPGSRNPGADGPWTGGLALGRCPREGERGRGGTAVAGTGAGRTQVVSSWWA